MANAVFTAKVETNVSMNLDGISLESWNRIRDFIRGVVEEENMLKGEAAKGEIVLPPADLTKVPDTAGTPDKAESPEKPADPYAKVERYKNHEDVIALFKDAEANPSGYTWEWRSSKVWMAECPTLANASLHGVAHTLGSMGMLRLVRKDRKYNEEAGIYENVYRVPVPVKTEEAEKETVAEENGSISPEDVAKGKKLRMARIGHDLTIGDLAELIGYDAAIINKWEWGLYTISSAAQTKLEDVFGKNLFAEVAA